jgi:DNA polymerase I-like protein with 3'-5' exonuclease and polymerase domains
MGSLSWTSIFEQLQAIGVEVPVTVAPGNDRLAARPEHAPPPSKPDMVNVPLSRQPPRADKPAPEALMTLLATAKKVGVKFMERVADGELIVEGLDQLAPVDRQKLQAQWDDARRVLLPEDISTASSDLLASLGIELVYIDTEGRAAAELQRLCESGRKLGLDLETAPRPEFLPIAWPIAVTKKGRRSKAQPRMDTSAALDPFRAEVRLLQVAAEIEGRMVVLVIDLRCVPLSSALAPLWCCKVVGHNLSFDVKMLMPKDVQIANENLVDTILLAGLVLRGVEDVRREGSRRPPLADAVQEALGLDLPKTSQCSPWWRDRLTQEQIAYAALDAVFALKLEAALTPRIAALGKGPDGKTLQTRLCEAVGPVARMEFAGITVNREELEKQVNAWDQELTALRDAIADKLGITNPSSAPQVAAWISRELKRLDATNSTNLVSSWPRTEGGSLSTKAKHLRRVVDQLAGAARLARFSAREQLRSNFGDTLLARIRPQTGRLHGSFLIAKAKSGRFSSANPNMQNIPRDEALRSVFVAASGQQLVVADYSQLELRVMAHIANDTVMTEAYRKGMDLHAVTAAAILGVTPDEFDPKRSDYKDARQKAKAVNFAVIYGAGAIGLKEYARDEYNLQITVAEARAWINSFFATYTGVGRWQREQEMRTRETRTVSTRGGRVHRFGWEPGGEYARNLALNLPIQGTAAEIAIEALIRIDARLRAELPGKAQLVLQVHDEFVVEVEGTETIFLAVKLILQEEMVAAFEALLPGAPTMGLVTAHSGSTWAAAKG